MRNVESSVKGRTNTSTATCFSQYFGKVNELPGIIFRDLEQLYPSSIRVLTARKMPKLSTEQILILAKFFPIF